MLILKNKNFLFNKIFIFLNFLFRLIKGVTCSFSYWDFAFLKALNNALKENISKSKP